MKTTSPWHSWLLLFACNLMWALQFTCIKLVQDYIGPLFTVWAPITLSVLMLAPIIRRERANAPVPPPGEKKPSLVGLYLLLGLVGVVPGQLFMTWGTRMTLASNAALITLTLPLATALFAVLFLRERMTLIRWVSFLLALGGVVLASGSSFEGATLAADQMVGNGLVFLAILGSAFYNSYGKRALLWHTPMEMLFWTYVVVSVSMGPIAFWQEPGSFAALAKMPGSAWLGLILLTFFHNFLSMVLFLKALKNIDAIQAALSNYMIAFFGIPIAALFLNERLTVTAILGGVLVLASTLVITLLDPAKEAETPPAA